MDALMTQLLTLLQGGHRMVQEAALTALVGFSTIPNRSQPISTVLTIGI